MALQGLNKNKVILVSDFDAQRRAVLASRLRHAGYDIEQSGSGFETIHLVEKSKKGNFTISLVLLFDDLEDMPGREVLNLIRVAIPNKDQLPILYVSEDSSPEDILQIIKDGANDYAMLSSKFPGIFKKVQKILPIK
jgi:CheY-like chemotaxis protein